jgi:hypothetical protein
MDSKLTSKAIRAMNFNADRMMEQQFTLLQEIAALMAERDECTPAATPSDAVTRDKERKKQIAELETEIDLLCKVWPAYYPSDFATMERIVDVEKARLAELKRGLREVLRG